MDEKLFNGVFDILNCMAGSGKIVWKVDFDTCIGKDGNYILRLNYNSLAEKLLEFFCDKYIRSGKNSSMEGSRDDETFMASMMAMGINPVGLKEEIRSKSYCIESSYPVNFYVHQGKERKTSYRSAILDVYKLQEAGADISNLLSVSRKER